MALRVAVCFFGLTRSLSFTLERIRAQLLDPLLLAGATVTTFGHTFNDTDHESSASMNSSLALARLLVPDLWIESTKAAWATGLEANFSRWHNSVGNGWQNRTDFGRNHVLQLYSLASVTSLWWPRLAPSFDVVIFSRFDVLY